MGKLFSIYLIIISLFCLQDTCPATTDRDYAVAPPREITNVSFQEETLSTPDFAICTFTDDSSVTFHPIRISVRNIQRTFNAKLHQTHNHISQFLSGNIVQNEQYRATLYTQGFYIYFMRKLII